MDRLERLVNLVVALLDAGHPIGREELRTRIGGYADDTDAFRRNFERDKELLRQMGIPLVVEPLDPRVPDGASGYRIRREHYELPEPGLAADELAALRLAASAVELEGAWGRGAATTALWKLAASTAADEPPGRGGDRAGDRAEVGAMADVPAGDRAGDRAEVGAMAEVPAGDRAEVGAMAEVPAGDHTAVLFGATAARRRVRFAYHGTEREVDPWRLSYRNGQWYLTGWDHARGDARTFRVDRLQRGPEPVGPPGAFARPAAADAVPPPPWQLGDDPEVVAEVLVDAVQADWAAAAVGEAAVAERRGDGSVVLKLTVTNGDALRSFVLGFLDHAEVLGPPALRDDMVAWLARLAGVDAGGR